MDYGWTITSSGTRIAGQGDRDALVAAVADFDPPGLAPPDWIVDILLADGFTEGVTTYTHAGVDGWSLEVREIPDP